MDATLSFEDMSDSARVSGDRGPRSVLSMSNLVASGPYTHAENLTAALRLADEQAQQILGHKATVEFQMAGISELEAVLHKTSARVDSLGNDLKQAEAQREEPKDRLGAILDSVACRRAYPIRWLEAFARRRRGDAVPEGCRRFPLRRVSSFLLIRA
jgi:hypothetical protein